MMMPLEVALAGKGREKEGEGEEAVVAGKVGEDSDLTHLTTGADSYDCPRAFFPH